MIYDLFDTDERLIINQAAKGGAISGFTRARMLSHLDLAINAVVDEMALEAARGLKEKIELLTDKKWKEVAMRTPLPTAYDSEGNVDDVPEDED